MWVALALPTDYSCICRQFGQFGSYPPSQPEVAAEHENGISSKFIPGVANLLKTRLFVHLIELFKS
jgi:hypothetical protein